MKYQIEFYDPSNGATSPIDVVEAPEGYTADNYIRDCKENADASWCEMLESGTIMVVELDEDE